ncbi:hypothetical protein SCUCBS95973_000408 [Sporothrix curviconia]|uniref:Chromosome transmission fidelity protein 4 n=1 Tax=Sporothrix curviconia TaxID=1260050 RepID=A0ABP0AQ40_9PEZI
MRAPASSISRLAASQSSPAMRRYLTTHMAAAGTASKARRQLLRSLLTTGRLSLPSSSSSASSTPSSASSQRLTTLPEAHPLNLPDVWFNATFPLQTDKFGGPSAHPGGKPPDERTVKLGKTLRILQERLPTLLQSPLPSEILAPTISLHLFPSTHPHLPVVSGRVAYVAALWTSPIAWNRVPLIGNVKLEILSERMTKQPLLLHSAAARRAGAGDEQLVVRWRTIGKGGMSLPPQQQSPDDGNGASTTAPVGTSQAVGDPKEFTGLFIFEFDGEGRVLSHTIEHVAEGGDWTRSVGARFVGLTDWLLGGIKGGGHGDSTPLPAFEMQDPRKMR